MTKCAQNGWDLFISIDQMSERSADTRTQTTRADPRKWLLESDNYEICLEINFLQTALKKAPNLLYLEIFATKAPVNELEISKR